LSLPLPAAALQIIPARSSFSSSPATPSIPLAAPSADAAPRADAVRPAERRQLTVMFCDLVGSTELSGRHDPEDYRELLRYYHDAMTAVIQRYGGYVANYLGDGVPHINLDKALEFLLGDVLA
jgi:class 3 adenylate cyclase